MIQVVVQLSAVPHQAVEVVRTLRYLQMTIQSVAGLVCSHIYTNTDIPDSFLYVEEWQAPEYLSQDAAAAHFKKLFALMERSTKAPVLRVASVSDTCGIEQLCSLMSARSDPAGLGSSHVKRRPPIARPPDGGSP